MSHFADYFSDASEDYRKYRPRYPAELYRHLAALAPGLDHAWDCGCGNGQAAVALADYFQRVTATDASAAQIDQAVSAPNVEYNIAPAEKITAPDESLDLITIAQAIHWFNHPRFFAEVDRALKPNGILAAWGYQLLYTDTDLDPVIKHFHRQVVGPYWPKGRELLDEGYSQIHFPYPREETPSFYMRQEWQLKHLIGYLNTWSAVKHYQQSTGENPVEIYFDQLRSAWGDEDQPKKIYWPLILYVGKKRVE